MKKNRLQVVAYCRVSTDNQKEEGTVEIQKHAVKEYCEIQGFELLEIYADEGVSGGLQDRPQLSLLFDFLEQNEGIHAVIVWKLDRLARDLYIQEHLLQKLEKIGVKLISIKESNLDGSDPVRKAFRQFLGFIAELEKSFICMRLKEGRKNKARKGGFPGGRVPFGYHSVQGELIIDGSQAEVVREIFKLRMNKHFSVRQIASELNNRGIPTKAGCEWKAGTIHAILKNSKYRGVFRYINETSSRPDLAVI